MGEVLGGSIVRRDMPPAVRSRIGTVQVIFVDNIILITINQHWIHHWVLFVVALQEVNDYLGVNLPAHDMFDNCHFTAIIH